jgi:hypothetical protein
MLHEVVDFGSLPVFIKASTYPAIFILSPARSEFLRAKKIEHPDQLNLPGITEAPVHKIAFHNLSEEPWNLGKLNIPSILETRSIPWKALCDFGQAYIGLLTGMDEAFVITREEAKRCKLEKDILFPYAYRGNEVHQYQYVQPDALVIYPYEQNSDGTAILIPESKLKKQFPKVYRHLLAYKDNLRQRKDSRRLYAIGSEWYRHLRQGSFAYILPPKLIIKGIDKRAVVGLLKEKTAFNGANCPGIIIEKSDEYSELYFLGIMNSKVVSFYLRSICPAKLNDYTRFNANNINTTPVRIIDFSNPSERSKHDKMVSLVEQMLELNKKLAGIKNPNEKTRIQRQIDSTDEQIDKLVYDLYGLSADEIAIVEGKK